jgi:arylsulfatase A-like enzyme
MFCPGVATQTMCIRTCRPRLIQFSTMSALLLIVAAASLVFIAPALGDETTTRPNIIFILADDLGYGELGCYGQTVIQTPHLDQMATEGLRFTHFYAGATVCAPSRSVLMTGLHHGHTRVRGNAGSRNPEAQALLNNDVTVAGLLQQSGYRTALVGKWGLGVS